MSIEFPKHPFLLSVSETADALDADIEEGLLSAKVNELQQKFPRNELEEGGRISWYTLLAKQIFNAMILVLIFVMVVSYAFKDWIEGGVVTFVIILNATIGFVQEYKAEKRMDALRALGSPSASVLRNGNISVIPNAEVVPGDIVLLKMGDTVPADLRLFEAMNLSCDESSLTGEAVPVEKTVANDILVPESEKLATTEAEVSIGDRTNIAYATTVVRKGRGRGIVIATGMVTEVGKIAASATKKHRKAGRSMNWKKYGKRQPFIGLMKRTFDAVGKFLGLTVGTPLQRKLALLAYVLFGCALLLAVVVFAVNRFKLPTEVILYATSLGIAIIPESLVAVLTITMVVSVVVMSKANVVVRDLSAIEALGGVTHICSDKTGTLTQGAMIVRAAWLPMNHLYNVQQTRHPDDPTEGTVTYTKDNGDTEASESPKRDFDQERSAAALTFDVPAEKLDPKKPSTPSEPAVPAEVTSALRCFLLSSALCNLATVRFDETMDKWQTTGEPTEIALQVFAHRFDLGKRKLVSLGWKEVAEFPFDSAIKRMSVVYHPPENGETPIGRGNSVIFAKGAVERILELCTHIGFGDDRQEITDDLKGTVMSQTTNLASQGQRVLAIAYREWDGKFTLQQSPGSDEADEPLRKEVESRLTLLGLAGIYDPPRRETKASIAECSTAGIRVHMLTGDHPETAKAIAKEVGIIPKNLSTLPAPLATSIVQVATDFDRMTDEEIDNLEELPLVIARCAPHTKTRMIEALRRRDAFSAMTGDGVNDAPSLSRADVGIAMGSGSDVAKAASAIVLADSKFNSIVAGIKEGRRMADNCQKFVLHLLTSNCGEVILLVAGLGFRDNSGYSVFPVAPLEILWINMITSSFPAFGLGREAAARNVMSKPPQNKKRGVFTNQLLVDMLVYGIIMGALTMATFVIVIYGANNGNLGEDCNKRYSPSCRPVFRARAAVFAELTWLILVSAWEFKDLRRSLFRLHPDDDRKFPLFKDVYENRFLFWSVVIGAVSVFPVVYIPGLNTNVFKHTSISWEWGLVVGATILFVLGVEAWKFIKRTCHLLEDHPVKAGAFRQGGGAGGDMESGGKSFIRTFTATSFKSWKSFGRTDTEAVGSGSGARTGASED